MHAGASWCRLSRQASISTVRLLTGRTGFQHPDMWCLIHAEMGLGKFARYCRASWKMMRLIVRTVKIAIHKLP